MDPTTYMKMGTDPVSEMLLCEILGFRRLRVEVFIVRRIHREGQTDTAVKGLLDAAPVGPIYIGALL